MYVHMYTSLLAKFCLYKFKSNQSRETITISETFKFFIIFTILLIQNLQLLIDL